MSRLCSVQTYIDLSDRSLSKELVPIRSRSLPACVSIASGGENQFRSRRLRAPACSRKETFMSLVQQMVEAHPRPAAFDTARLVACIEACFTCAQTCASCSDACLGESEVMVACVRRCADCSDVCVATGRILSRQTEFEPAVARAIVQACRAACEACAAECERHAHHHEHCRICAGACRECERACADVLEALG